jgi:outer membrane lipoprotein-sorting protein
VDTYQVTLKSFAGGKADVIHYAYRKPGYIRMDFVEPHRGVVLIYSPSMAEVRLWPLGLEFFSLRLDPANRLIQSHAGQRIDRSDIGALLQNVQALQRTGETRSSVTNLSGRAALEVMVTGKNDAMSAAIHRYDVWLDPGTWMPLKVISRDTAGHPIEEVLFEDLRIDPELPATMFSPQQTSSP